MTDLHHAIRRLLAFVEAESERRDGTGGEYEAEALQAVKDAESLLEVTPQAVVKELEWNEILPRDCWHARTSFGIYGIERSESGGFFWVRSPDDLELQLDTHTDLEAAKAACQAHYEERVLACLEAGADASSAPCKAHSDDLAVERFAKRMKAKLKCAREIHGRHGWDDPEQCSIERLAKLCLNHVSSGDPVDVANFCMMLSERGVKGNGGPLAIKFFDRLTSFADFVKPEEISPDKVEPTAPPSAVLSDDDLKARCQQWAVVTPESNPDHLQSAKLFSSENEARAYASAPERRHHRVIPASDMKALSELMARSALSTEQGGA